MAILNYTMFFFSTEITSSHISSDTPLFQRTKKAYELIADKVHGNILEIGSGEGYGLEIIYNESLNITAVDKASYANHKLRQKFPKATIIQQQVPPLTDIPSNSQDVVITFQVIEHIQNDRYFLEEIYRVLKPNGTLFLTTPNATQSVTRNPWHYKEYLCKELTDLLSDTFTKVTVKGITGKKATMEYYDANKRSVAKILQWDILKLEKRAPKFLLRIPYEIFNRINRRLLLKNNKELVNNITSADYFLTDDCNENTLDFFCIATK
ncbi:conserved hypothetical protein [Tenacibaculum amylolyticum]